jgi:hypothetical protein
VLSTSWRQVGPLSSLSCTRSSLLHTPNHPPLAHTPSLLLPSPPPSGLEQLLAAERSAALEEAAARLAWSSEAAALGAAKLRAFFLAPLAVELVALAPFGGGPPATTLRQATLLPEVQVGVVVVGG